MIARLHQLDFIGREAKAYLQRKGVARRTRRRESLAEFASRAGQAIRFIAREPEIVLFSALQWLAIAMAYFVWVQVLGWIPEETWNSDSKLEEAGLNAAVLAWSALCVAAAAYPIGVLTGAMGAAFFLRQAGQPSTIAACIKLAWPKSARLWAFHAVDAWLTVDIILERLPKKRHFSPAVAARRALAEAIYYAWKVGTIGVPPALLAGRTLVEAGKESMALLKRKTWEVVRLRAGYSAICWIVGVATYFGAIAYMVVYAPSAGGHEVLSFYVWAGLPILIAVGVIKLLVRPVYVIASCQLYHEFLEDRGRSPDIGSAQAGGAAAFAAFVGLCVLIVLVIVYREQIGLMKLLAGGS